MQSVLLNQRCTTQLGFGGSVLGSTSSEIARGLLREAFEAGIRHFDVAPMYGFGQSERLLREALGPRLRDVTITTKYGLTAPAESALRGTARRLLAPFPGVARRLRGVVSKHHASDVTIEDHTLPALTGRDAQASIDSSLRNLCVETLDLLLLHEATPGRLQDCSLLEVLERNRSAGKLREFGVGSRASRVAACVSERPEYCPFLQFEWSVFSPPATALAAYPRILHGSLAAQPVWSDDVARLERWSKIVQLDLRRPGTMPSLLLKASLLANAGHIVLFSTRMPERIRANVATAEDGSLEAPARALIGLVERERNTAENSLTVPG